MKCPSSGDRPEPGGEQEQRLPAPGQAGEHGVQTPDPVLHLRDRLPQGNRQYPVCVLLSFSPPLLYTF